VLGGGLTKLLMLRREGEKVAAETDSIEATVTDLNWKRMQREIDRLAKRVEAGERRISELEAHLSSCQRERAMLETENIRLKAAQDARGEVRQRAAQIVAVERLEGRE
jgi:hypothetical protein